MSLVVPDWVAHISTDNDDKDKKKPTCIFSLHVHPDGSRIATGGIDQKIRIWATEPILDPAVEKMPGAHRLLTTLARHSGSVVSVRFSPSGRFLASGSDDTVCLIWETDPYGASGGSFGSFGSSETNVESWRIHRRLTGHESDVVDVAWSADPDDSYLATVGLDSVVNIWSGAGQNGRPGFERIRRIAGHDGFVKGVVWDPRGHYLATQSDDKTMKIWRTSDWSCAKVITEPFQHSPSSNFFGRPSWSPDGAHIIAANAMSGPIFVASIVARGSWNTGLKLVGHEDSVVVAAFSPRLFRHPGNPNGPPLTVLALGSRDQSISIWMTGVERPILVLKDVFDRQVTDLSWSCDGLTLFASSTSGTVAAICLTKDIVAEPLPAEKSFAVRPQTSALPQSVGHVQQAAGTTARPNMLQPRKAGAPPPARASVLPASPATAAPGPGPPRPANARAGAARLPQQIQILANGKRRIRPTLIYGEEPYPQQQQQELPPAPQHVQTNNRMDVDAHYHQPPTTNGHVSYHVPEPDRHRPTYVHDALPPSTFKEEQAFDAALATSRLAKGRSRDGRIVGGDLPRENLGVSVEIRPGEDGDFFSKGMPKALSLPAVMSTLRRDGEGGGVVEVRNYDGSRPVEVAVLDKDGPNGKVLWMDFLSRQVVRCALSLGYLALAQDDGVILVYTNKGRRISTFALDSPVCLMDCCGATLMAITTAGCLHRWDLQQDKELHRPISCLSILRDPDDVHNVLLHANGAPILILKTEQAWTVDPKKNVWTLVASGWFADCSPIWDGRSRGRGPSTAAGNATNANGGFSITDGSGRWREPVRAIESEINSLVVARPTTGREPALKPADDPARLRDFELAATLRHLELRMQAAPLLGSKDEYVAAVKAYALKIADEGLKGLGEELVRELVGPIYYVPGEETKWEPCVLDQPKRALCREILPTMAKNRVLAGMVQTYQELLKNMA